MKSSSSVDSEGNGDCEEKKKEIKEQEMEVVDDVAEPEMEPKAPSSKPSSATTASIFTSQASARVMKKTTRIRTGGKAPRGNLSNRPSARLYRKSFHNLIHNYGIENTSRTHL